MGDAQPDNGASENIPVASAYYYRPKEGGQLHEGELLRQVWEWVARYDDEGKGGAQSHVHQIAVIVSQECDLAQDFEKRRGDLKVETDLLSVLLCRAFPADRFRTEHDFRSSKLWAMIRSNREERYQYLAAVPPEADAAGRGNECMVVDFKGYFTVRTVELYRQVRATDEKSAALFTALNIPWREHLQQRFVSYQARVGLPLDHFIPESRRSKLATPSS